jgi:hypothetical protein
VYIKSALTEENAVFLKNTALRPVAISFKIFYSGYLIVVHPDFDYLHRGANEINAVYGTSGNRHIEYSSGK